MGVAEERARRDDGDELATRVAVPVPEPGFTVVGPSTTWRPAVVGAVATLPIVHGELQTCIASNTDLRSNAIDLACHGRGTTRPHVDDRLRDRLEVDHEDATPGAGHRRLALGLARDEPLGRAVPLATTIE